MIPSNLNSPSWQWQPTLTVHDPNPPITLEDVVVTGNTYDDSVSVARLEALFSAATYSLGASLTLLERDSIFQSNVTTMGAGISLSELNGISDRATVSIGKLVSINQLTGFNNSLALGAFSVVNLSDRLSILHGANVGAPKSLSIGETEGLSASTTLDSRPVIVLSERDGVSTLATLHIFPSVIFTEREGVSFSAGLSVFQFLSLAGRFFLVTDSTVIANVVAVILQTLSETLGISSSVQMNRQASLPVAEKVGISGQVFQIINPSTGLNVICSIVTSEGQAVIIVRGFGYVFTQDSGKSYLAPSDTSNSVSTGDS